MTRAPTTRPPTNALSPKKLLHTQWTAVVPKNKEKHFLVTKVIEPVPLGSPVVSVEIEAVHSKRARIIGWRELTDAAQWRRGWV
ncbi:MAG: TIGR02450 family Trp-rich protein [Gammaproteobacteria bacterium]